MCPWRNKWWMTFKNSKVGITFLFLFLTHCGFITGSHSFVQTDSSSPIGEEDLGFVEEDFNALHNRPFQKKVGIVFVIDTTYSMVRHLQQASHTFRNFIPALKPLDWQMMFTNADYNPNSTPAYYNSNLFMGQAMLLGWKNHVLPYKTLYSHSEKNQQVFLNTLKRYEQGDSAVPNRPYINPCELPPFCQGSVRNPIQSLIQAFYANKAFFKSATNFIAIIWTNGDNMHNTNHQKEEVTQTFQTLHGENKTLTVYSISIIPKDENCLKKDQKHFSPYRFAHSEPSHKIHELVRDTKGKTMNICDPDYSPLAKDITHSLL